MTEGTKLIFAGDHFWSVPKNAEITVGPTIPIGRQKLYIDYTEKYGSRAKLVRSDTGDYVPGNYIAGAPGPYEAGIPNSSARRSIGTPIIAPRRGRSSRRVASPVFPRVTPSAAEASGRPITLAQGTAGLSSPGSSNQCALPTSP